MKMKLTEVKYTPKEWEAINYLSEQAKENYDDFDRFEGLDLQYSTEKAHLFSRKLGNQAQTTWVPQWRVKGPYMDVDGQHFMIMKETTLLWKDMP